MGFQSLVELTRLKVLILCIFWSIWDCFLNCKLFFGKYLQNYMCWYLWLRRSRVNRLLCRVDRREPLGGTLCLGLSGIKENAILVIILHNINIYKYIHNLVTSWLCIHMNLLMRLLPIHCPYMTNICIGQTDVCWLFFWYKILIPLTAKFLIIVVKV